MKLRFQPFDLLKKSLYLNMDLRYDNHSRLTYTFTYSKIYHLNHGASIHVDDIVTQRHNDIANAG